MALMKYREPNQVKWQGARPAHNGEQKIIRNSAENALVNVYTVPAGNTGFFHYFNISVIAGANPGYFRVDIYNTVPVFVSTFIRVDLPANAYMSKLLELYYPLEVLEGWSVRIKSSAVALIGELNIMFWIE